MVTYNFRPRRVFILHNLTKNHLVKVDSRCFVIEGYARHMYCDNMRLTFTFQLEFKLVSALASDILDLGLGKHDAELGLV